MHFHHFILIYSATFNVFLLNFSYCKEILNFLKIVAFQSVSDAILKWFAISCEKKPTFFSKNWIFMYRFMHFRQQHSNNLYSWLFMNFVLIVTSQSFSGAIFNGLPFHVKIVFSINNYFAWPFFIVCFFLQQHSNLCIHFSDCKEILLDFTNGRVNRC